MNVITRGHSGFEAKNPEYEARVRDSFSRQPFMDHIGAVMDLAEPGHCVLSLPTAEHLTQQHGFIHGGVLATLADCAAGYAAFTLMGADAAPLTVEYKLNILRPGGGERIVARAQVIKPGRTLNVVQSDVFNLQDGKETMCVTSLQTLMTMQGWSDEKRR